MAGLVCGARRVCGRRRLAGGQGVTGVAANQSSTLSGLAATPKPRGGGTGRRGSMGGGVLTNVGEVSSVVGGFPAVGAVLEVSYN
jgi:hypothetical protein